jgi:hypothetical protein
VMTTPWPVASRQKGNSTSKHKRGKTSVSSFLDDINT